MTEKKIVDDHRQNYIEITKNILGLRSQTNVCDFYRQKICSVDVVSGSAVNWKLKTGDLRGDGCSLSLL